MNPKPVYILLAGVDRVGKSTLAASIYAKLTVKHNQKSVLLTREPGSYNNLATMELRKLLKHESIKLDPLTKLHLFIADRNEHMLKVVKPALDMGNILIQDRGFLCTLAYQSALGYDRELLIKLVEMTLHNIYPDIIIFFDVDPITVANRSNVDDDYEALDFQNRVYVQYKYEFNSFREKHPEIDYIIVNNTISIDETTDIIINQIKSRRYRL